MVRREGRTPQTATAKPQEKAAAANINIEKTLALIEQITRQLETITLKETEALKAYDMQKFIDFQAEKARLAKNYEIEAQKLLSVREKLKEADPELRKHIRQVQENFIAASEENATLLTRRRISAQRLNERIMTAARAALCGEETSYTARGLKRGDSRKTLSSGAGSTI